MPLKAVIFGFGGVLVRTQSQERRREWEQRLGLEPGRAEYIVFGGESGWAIQLGQLTDQAHWQALGVRFGLADEDMAQLREDFFARDVLDTELLGYVDRLRAAGYHLGILSNASDIARDMFARVYGVADHFDSITISAEEGVMKPDPRIFQIALKRAGVEPHEAVFVDDVLVNVEAARRAGMLAVHFTDPVRAHSEWATLTGVE